MATATAAKTRATKSTAAPAEAITPDEEAKIEDANAARQAPAKKAETESQKRNRLRNEAERVIINRYKSEFEDVATELFAEHGLKFNKRMTEEQKATAKVKELIAANPSMKAELLALLGAGAQAPAAEYDPAPAPEPGHVPYGEYDENSFAADGPGNWDQDPSQQ